MRTRRTAAPSRKTAYFTLRGLAALGVVGASLLPSGLPAALLCIGCGLLAVLTCVGVNAGAAGEQAGSRAQARAYDRLRAPVGDWPPYAPGDQRVVEHQG